MTPFQCMATGVSKNVLAMGAVLSSLAVTAELLVKDAAVRARVAWLQTDREAVG